MNKIQNLSRKLLRIFEIIRTFAYSGVVLGLLECLFFSGWYLLLRKPITFAQLGFEIGQFSFFLNEVISLDGKEALLCGIVSTLCMTAAATILALMVRSICDILRPLTEGQPFHQEAALHTRRLGWLTIAYGLARIVSDMVLHNIRLYLFDPASFFHDERLIRVDIQYPEFSLEFIFFALLLFLLSHVFRHGAQLQQLSDETL